MRPARIRFSVRRMMLAVAVLGVATWVLSSYPTGWTHYVSGWCDAERALRRGKAVIYKLDGLFSVSSVIHCVDRDTGLPVQWFTVPSCGLAYNGECEWAKGYNDHVAQYVRWHGPPKNSFKPWENELFNLRRFFNDQSRTEAAKRLVAGKPGVVSPDGRYRVQPVAGLDERGVPNGSLWLDFSAGNVMLSDCFVRPFIGDSDLHWGPKGSPMVVVRSISGYGERYSAFDLGHRPTPVRRELV